MRSAEISWVGAISSSINMRPLVKNASINSNASPVIHGYDIIGDVHGCASSLIELLDRLGYRDVAGVYRYFSDANPAQQRTVIFVGDLVDRGPEIRRTLAIVKAMVDAGTAQMVLGNHEFSAIAYHTPVADGYLRAHNLRSAEQIKQTLDEFQGHKALWQDYLNWFRELPLFLEFDGFRVVHACWDHQLIAEYQQAFSTNRLSDERIADCADHKSLSFRVIDRLTRGISLHLPDGLKMKGRDGYLRHNFRVNFWSDSAEIYDDVHFQPDQLPEPLPHRSLSDAEKQQLLRYEADEKLLFIGHYWLEGQPAPVAENIACLDYSAVHDGQLVAYRFDVGDTQLKQQNFVSVKADDLALGTVNG